MATPERIGAPNRFIGVSTDTKPSDGSGLQVHPGATYYEYDTGNLFITYDHGSNWKIKGDVAEAKTKTVTGSSSGAGLALYTANDIISNSTGAGTTIAFAAIARENGGSGYITKANIVLGTSNITPRLTMYLFNALPVGGTLNDNSPNLHILGTDTAKYQGRIDWLALDTVGSGLSQSVATPSTYGNVPLSFGCASGADDLFGVLVTRDTVTAGTNVTISIDLTAEQL
jgi:hypothetical protein